MSTSLARAPQLGSKPVSLSVKLKPRKDLNQDPLQDGLQDLYRSGAFTDVTLLCAEQRYKAHSVVLAARSLFLRDALSKKVPEAGMQHEIRLEIPNPEAVKIMLDFIYRIDTDDWASFNPMTQDINRDVLQLAHQFQLPDLTHQAMHWLGKDLTTGNVVERLAICKEYGLEELSNKIVEQLTCNKQALSEVSNSQQILKYPELMVSLLQSAAAAPESEQKAVGKRGSPDAKGTTTKKRKS